MNNKTTSFLASAGLIFVTIIWGFAFVVVKDSLDSIGPVWMVAFRFTIAAVGLSLFTIKRFQNKTRHDWFNGLVTGFFLYAAYLTQTIGCNYTTAGKNAFLTTVYVMLVPLLSWPLYKKRPGWYVFVAAAMSLTGIGLLSLGNGDKGINIGDLLTLVCGLFYALHILWTEKCNKEGVDTIFLTVQQFIFAALFAWLSAPFIDGSFPTEGLMNNKVILSMLYLGVLSSLLAFLLQNISLKYLPGPLASLFMSFESVFGILFSIIFLHEAVSVKMAFGCILIFMAVLLAETRFDFFRHKKTTKILENS
ncbi:MAG: DMT family transporter [Treponema sp.]|nr:DMT family transporter [Treponema sp.]